MLSYDVNVFSLLYDNRIGQVFKDTNNLYVYTGYIDPFTGMPFMSYAIGK